MYAALVTLPLLGFVLRASGKKRPSAIFLFLLVVLGLALGCGSAQSAELYITAYDSTAYASIEHCSLPNSDCEWWNSEHDSDSAIDNHRDAVDPKHSRIMSGASSKLQGADGAAQSGMYRF
jgi:hypothetical protein